ncbi:unnamed protein product [Peronospora effusa]|nr:unnamed protein product [Peronospora effusa]
MTPTTASTNDEDKGAGTREIMQNWAKYVPDEWPPPDDVVPAEPKEEEYPNRREYGSAVHLRTRVMKQWKKNYERAKRAKEPQPDLSAIDTAAQLKKRSRHGKDRLGLSKKSRKKGRPRVPYAIGNQVWCSNRRVPIYPRRGKKTDGQDCEDELISEEEIGEEDKSDGEDEASKEVDLTQEEIGEEEPSPGTRQCILQNHDVGQRVAWPSDVRYVTTMQNPDKITFDNRDVREEKCGCEDLCDIATCLNAVEEKVCETGTCTPGVKACDNRFRQRRMQLKMMRTGIGVMAARPIPAGAVVCQYWGKYVVDVREKSSIHRAITTAGHEGTSRSRKRIFLQEQRSPWTIPGKQQSALWFHCQCQAHQKENQDAIQQTKIKLEAEEAANGGESRSE